MLESDDDLCIIHLQLLQLLLKASQDKRFVCEEAEKSLEKMAVSVPPLPFLKKLQSYVNHSNLRVRAKAAVAISKCVSKMVSMKCCISTACFFLSSGLKRKTKSIVVVV